MKKATFYLETIKLSNVSFGKIPITKPVAGRRTRRKTGKKKERKLGKEDIINVNILLLHPRYGKQSVIFSWAMDYGEYLKDPNVNKKPNTNKLNNFIEKEMGKNLKGMLFKEVVEGLFALKIEVKVIDKKSGLGKFINGVLKAGAGAYLGVITSGISSVVLTEMSKQGGKNILDIIFDDKDKTYQLCTGFKELTSATLENNVLVNLKPKKNKNGASAKGSVNIRIESQ